MKTLEQVRLEYTLEVLRKCGNNKSKAALILDVSVKTIYNILSKLTEPSKFEGAEWVATSSHFTYETIEKATKRLSENDTPPRFIKPGEIAISGFFTEKELKATTEHLVNKANMVYTDNNEEK